VRLYGLNGLLIVNVLLLALAVVCAYAFLTVQSPPVAAALFTSAFFGAAALPVYGAFLMPDIFNLAIVLLAYFLWLYKEVRAQDVRLKPDATYEPTPIVVMGVASSAASGLSRTLIDTVASGFSRTFSTISAALMARWTDFAAAVVGVATYSAGPGSGAGRVSLVRSPGGAVNGLAGLRSALSVVAAAVLPPAPERRRHRRIQLPGGDRKTFIDGFVDHPTRRGKASAGHRRSRPGV
jgi:hypothetical protein